MRVVDVVITAVLGVAFGVLFSVWNYTGGAAFGVFEAVTPGFGGIITGIWLLGGVVGGLVVRRPGAALAVEVIAAVVSMVPGNQWGISTVYSGIAQGLGAELAFALTLYRRGSMPTAVLAGVLAAVVEFALELVTSGNLARTLGYNLTYLGCMVVSAAVLAGVLGHVLVGALARTGALDAFPAGRARRV
ncbi:ECF transporter S component [Corynebacterium bovis]|uniref:Uncharacterized protein n=2 Tax=Corynebacterium bovis TaxID=36808 RepID=A0A426Q303_9CORY|nr:ECF transporter S component [Corynebacterium bovis]MDH2455597.1 ECF transporter S component [Corynebacterium bovis]MDK8511237.1 ECF transporter S component [Corynebacterium bovis]RRO80833.1 hypothetical protein CXF38_05525 [Corynebacterium bovis]RRO82938.1 hypothetical protein CXF36_04645 [Corynebacterium bovis]RRO84547.1 hypothetical protein CXF37_02885 [Corynebacterium bovis]